MTSRGVFVDTGMWQIDIDTETRPGQFVVTLNCDALHIVFVTSSLAFLRMAEGFLRQTEANGTVALGRFHDGCVVELTTFGETGAFYLAAGDGRGCVLSLRLDGLKAAALADGLHWMQHQLRLNV